MHALHGLRRLWSAVELRVPAPAAAAAVAFPWAARQRHVREYLHLRWRWRLRRWWHGLGVLDMHALHGLRRLRPAVELRVPAPPATASSTLA